MIDEVGLWQFAFSEAECTLDLSVFLPDGSLTQANPWAPVKLAYAEELALTNILGSTKIDGEPIKVGDRVLHYWTQGGDAETGIKVVSLGSAIELPASYSETGTALLETGLQRGVFQLTRGNAMSGQYLDINSQLVDIPYDTPFYTEASSIEIYGSPGDPITCELKQVILERAADADVPEDFFYMRRVLVERGSRAGLYVYNGSTFDLADPMSFFEAIPQTYDLQ